MNFFLLSDNFNLSFEKKVIYSVSLNERIKVNNKILFGCFI